MLNLEGAGAFTKPMLAYEKKMKKKIEKICSFLKLVDYISITTNTLIKKFNNDPIN